MSFSDIAENLNSLEKKDARAIVNLIDLKVDIEMNKVLDEIKTLRTEMKNDINSLRIDMDTQFEKILYKSVGITVTVLGALIVFMNYFPLG